MVSFGKVGTARYDVIYYDYDYDYDYGNTNVWMPRVKNKSFGRAANRVTSRGID